jgi:hypothetical protein
VRVRPGSVSLADNLHWICNDGTFVRLLFPKKPEIPRPHKRGAEMPRTKRAGLSSITGAAAVPRRFRLTVGVVALSGDRFLGECPTPDTSHRYSAKSPIIRIDT